MVFHVGIDAESGKVAAYNIETNETMDFKVMPVRENEIDKVEAMFKRIKDHIIGKLGYACIKLEKRYDNNIRKAFISKGRETGFLEIQLISPEMAIYMYCMIKAQYKQSSDELIWTFLYFASYMWEKPHTKATIKSYHYEANLTPENTLNFGMRFDKTPGLIICDKTTILDKKTFKSTFPLCEYYLVDSINYQKAALMKARITSGDPEVLEYDVGAQLSSYENIKTDGENFIKLNYFQKLPFETTKICPINVDNHELNITFGTKPWNNSEALYKNIIAISSEMKNAGGIKITFKIDENRICTIDYSICKREEMIDQRCKACFVKIYRFVNNKTSYNIPQRNQFNNFESNIVGIDLGTSRCYAAVCRRNGMVTVALDNTGERMLPSFVSFNEEKEKCGQLVVNQLQNYSKSTVFDSKRLIGRELKDIKIDVNWPFEVYASENIPLLRIQGTNNTLEKHPVEVLAILLKHMMQKVQEFQGKIPELVVITVPAAFTKRQKAATHSAAELAGWQKIHLLPEPVAASIAYFIERPIPDNSYFLLFDLGGGTFDICIFKHSMETLEIINNVGDMNFGGRDFDNILITHFGKILRENYDINVISTDRLKYKLMQNCMEIKHTLSSTDKAVLNVIDYKPDSDDNVEITRETFENLCAELMQKITILIYKAFLDASCGRSQISKILLAGGGCRMPMVKKLLKEMFPNAELCCEEHPDEVVAIGAAYYAYYLNSKEVDSASLKVPKNVFERFKGVLEQL